MVAFSALAPQGGPSSYLAGSGTSYAPDSTGLISSISNTADAWDLARAGCLLLPFFGKSSAALNGTSNINRQISSAGIQPGGLGADNVLAVYSLPASAFDVLGRGLCISAQGSFGATANTKRVKLIFNATTAVIGSTVTGGTTVADTGAVVTNGGGWSLQANIFKYGAAGSNTQIGLHSQAQVGAAVSALLAPSLITATESGAILIAVTGNATTATTDILFNFLEVLATN